MSRPAGQPEPEPTPAAPNRAVIVARRVGWLVSAGCLAIALLLGLGAALRPDGQAPQPAPATAGPAADPITPITRIQRRLTTSPRDWASWAELGMAYVERARVTGDPSYYARAQGALTRSLAIQPQDNDAARTGLAALAAARHDFTGALRHGRAATAVNPYSAVAYGITGDALIELGRYSEAYVAIQRSVDLRPDTSSLARASYSWELRGNPVRARQDLEQALSVAGSADEAGFALNYLGELAFNTGDLRTAATRYDEGLRRAPDFLPLLAGRAKVRAAQGRTAAAEADYRTVLSRLPLPAYAAEYGDLLAAGGDRAGAARQYDLVRTQQRLLAAGGVKVDAELALFDADHGAPAAALAAATTAYQQRRGVFVADTLAWALHRNGRNAEALRYAREAARLGTRSALLRYHRGMIEAALGQDAAARASLTEALRINPYFSPTQAPKARAALAGLGR